LYTMVEEINKDFLKDDFYDKKGNLFKGDPNGDLKWYGSSASSYYSKYELKTNETQNNWSDLVRLLDKINNSTTAQFHDSLETILNTSTVIESWAATSLFMNLDSYLGSGHNYYVYDDSITNKFSWILWDVNEAFGNFNMGLSISQLEAASMYYINSPASRPLYNKMVSNTTYKAQLTNQVCSQVENYFSNSYMDPIIDSLANAIRSAVYADTLKSYSNQNFEDNIVMDINLAGGPGMGGNFPGLKPFITARRNAVITELSANGCNVGIKEVEAAKKITCFPNPASDFVSVDFEGELSALSVYSIEGKVLFQSFAQNKNKINVSLLSPGVYFIKLQSNGNFYFSRFVKQ
jgi:hypothetical protein